MERQGQNATVWIEDNSHSHVDDEQNEETETQFNYGVWEVVPERSPYVPGTGLQKVMFAKHEL